ncbi:NUDIX domain [Diaporthe eres]
MQHRADTRSWAIPGGARDQGETFRQTALREAEEEISLPRNYTEGPSPLVVVRREVTLLDHAVWRYVTLIADVVGPFSPARRPGDAESLSVEWVPIDQVGVSGGRFFPLLPAFWEAWPALLGMVREMDRPVLRLQPPIVRPMTVQPTTVQPTTVQPTTVQPTLAETGEPVPPPGVPDGSGDAPVPGPFTYISGNEGDPETEIDWLTGAEEGLCVWYIPAMP